MGLISMGMRYWRTWQPYTVRRQGPNGRILSDFAQEVFAEAQGAILPLVPYLDTLRWLFIALALGRIAVPVWARVDDWRKGLR